VKLGLGSYAFPWAIQAVSGSKPLDVFGLIDLALELGVRVVQVTDNLPLHCLSQSVLARLESLIRRRRLIIEVGTRGLDPDRLRTYLHLATRFHCPFVRLVTDTPEGHPSPKKIISCLQAVADDYAAHRIRIALENHDHTKARELKQIIERVGGERIGICLDTANSVGAGEGLDNWIDRFGPQILSVHLKDYRVKRSPHGQGLMVTGCPAGKGELEIPRFLARLRAAAPQVNVILEQWIAPDATDSAVLARERLWAQKSVQYLRRLIAE
jgi:3-oxoisoapionate decarboxylase